MVKSERKDIKWGENATLGLQELQGGTIRTQRKETHPGYHAKYLVDDDVLGGDPANPSEVTKTREHQTGEPVPHKSDPANDQEKVDTGDSPTVGDRIGFGVHGT